MSIILLILKIIGWILLTLTALFLLIVFLVLVVPVRYRTDGSIEENIRVQGKMHWLLHILSFGFSYNEEGFSYTLKLDRKSTRLNSSHANISRTKRKNRMQTVQTRQCMRQKQRLKTYFHQIQKCNGRMSV